MAFSFSSAKHHDRTARHEIGQRVVERTVRVHRIKLLGLMLGDLQHLHGKNVKAVFLELLNDVADRVLLHRVGLDDGQSAFQRLHI